MPFRNRPDHSHPATLRLAARAALVLGIGAATAAAALPQLQSDPPPTRAASAAGAPTAPPSAAPEHTRRRAVEAASRSRRAATVAVTASPAATLRKVRVEIPFKTVRRADPERRRGREKVVRAGRDGVRVRTYRVTATGRTLVSDHVGRLPVTRIVAVGTRKPRPSVERSTPSRTSRERRVSRERAAVTDDGLNWAALARCESGGNPRATNPSGKYRGMYQFDRRTWASVGGSGDPADASAAEQTRRAQRLYQRAGRSPWPECGRRL